MRVNKVRELSLDQQRWRREETRRDLLTPLLVAAAGSLSRPQKHPSLLHFWLRHFLTVEEEALDILNPHGALIFPSSLFRFVLLFISFFS